ncbi:MAG: GNAT family protein [Anaerolineaceae bacterium]|nr:GNAT family protein [Anaerolineaceae bacterium]
MSTANFKGHLVRLAVTDLEIDTKLMAQWSKDGELDRLLDTDPAYLRTPKQEQEWLQDRLKETCSFMIHTLADDRTIGFVDLSGFNWSAGDAYVGIGLGERGFWGQGYGTDAMRIILRYAFEELNLRRVSLTVFEYNPRGIRSYEKAGFKVEGRARQAVNRSGKRWDIIFMGILRNEWEAARLMI